MATNKYFQTAKDKQTAPILNNATIYRAKRTRDTDSENQMITNSYYTPLKLQSTQQPTFVDALKHRIDSSGKPITISQILNKNNNNNPSSSTNPTNPSDSTTPPNPIQPIQSIQSNTNTQQTNNNNTDSDNDSSSDDFDMNDLNNLTVPKAETTTNIMESDDIREKFKQRLQIEKETESQNAPIIISNKMISNDNNSSDSCSESEYETDSSSDDESDNSDNINPRKRKIKFLNKQTRDKYFETTNTHSCALNDETDLLEQFEQERQTKMKEQTHEDLLNYIRQQEKLENETHNSDEELPDDNDNLNDIDAENEFNAWKLREIQRCLRDENMKKNRETEKMELDIRRKMTDDEIIKDNEKLGLNKEKKRGNMKFMQKYYHSGVFYRDGNVVDDGVLDRNFNAPTGQDKYINFEKVPEAMRTKNFGKMSQSKWTHLANEDTTFDKQDKEWFKKKDGLADNEREKMKKDRYMFRHKAYGNNFWFKRAGTGTVDRPSYKKGNVNNWNNKRFERKEDGKFDRRDRGGRRDRDKDKRKRRRDR